MDDAIDSGDGTGEALELEAAPTPGRRRALWAVLAAIAVAAGAVVVNTAGEDDRSKLPIALGAAAAERSAGSAPMAADMSMLAWVTYVAGDDLPALGGSGPAYRLNGSVTRGEVESLGRALGLEGEVVQTEGSWRLETDHGMVEVYEGFGGTWWYSSETYPKGVAEPAVGSSGSSGSSGSGSSGCDPSGDDPEARERCAAAEGSVPVPTTDVPITTTTTGATVPADTPVSDCPPDAACVDPGLPEPITPPADLPSESEARRIALELLAATGLDVDDAKVTVDGPYDAWYVSVEPRIDGLLVSGLSASVSVGSKGEVTNASGYLAERESLGDYPVVDTRAAIDRLNAQMGGFGTFERGDAVAADEGLASDSAVASDLTAPYTTVADTTIASEEPTTTIAIIEHCETVEDPAAGASTESCVRRAGPYVPPEPVEIVLHEAERILMVVPSFDESGDSYLVPGYRFRGDEESVVDGISVDDDSLAPPPTVPDPPVTTMPRDVPGGRITPTTSGCAPVAPGPDGAVPEICMVPPSTLPVEEPQP